MKIPMNTCKRIFFFAAALSGLVFGTVRLSAQTATLYGLTFFDNELISVNPSTGEGTLVANLSASVTGYGLAFRGSQAYTFDPTTDGIRQINLATGAVGASINIGVGNLTGEGDLAFRSDGIGFLSSALSPSFAPTNDLFRFDLTTGTSTRIGTTSVALDGMAFFGNTLYGIGYEAGPRLYTVDQGNGALTAVGSLGLELGSPFSALTFGASGQLYAALDDRLYTINRLTGAAAPVSALIPDFGFGSVSGLAAAPAPAVTPVPEPSTYGLLGAAGLGLVVWARRKRLADAESRSC